VHVVLRQVVGDTGEARMDIATAQVLGADHLTRGSLDQRRAT